MKKFLAIILSLTFILSLAACGKTATKDEKESTKPAEVTEDDSNASFGTKLVNEFKKTAPNAASAEEIANVLSAKTLEIAEMDCGIMPVSEGLLTGFGNEEITGFKSGYVFSPYIGSIPFVGYVFETDDPAALKSLLESNADPAWNICTEAAETVTDISGNYVFFAMCPAEGEY